MSIVQKMRNASLEYLRTNLMVEIRGPGSWIMCKSWVDHSRIEKRKQSFFPRDHDQTWLGALSPLSIT
jgi:hypothetical protein